MGQSVTAFFTNRQLALHHEEWSWVGHICTAFRAGNCTVDCCLAHLLIDDTNEGSQRRENSVIPTLAADVVEENGLEKASQR